MKRIAHIVIGTSALGAALLTAAPAAASDQPGALPNQWFEELSNPTPNHTTDAGFTIPTANITRGAGPLTQIRGTLVQVTGATSNDLDVDIFCININNPAGFSALVSGGFNADSNLSLFTPAGVAIAFNDSRTDANSGHAKLSSLLVASLAPGDYFLAISRNDGSRYQRPLDAMGNLIFPGPPNGSVGVPAADPSRKAEFGPTVPGTLLAGWEANPPGGFAVFNLPYTITLTGATYSALPAPGSAALLGVGALAGARRRRR